MPKIIVEIEWDWPNEPSWLNADNVALALRAYYCEDIHFAVRDMKQKAELYIDTALCAHANKKAPKEGYNEGTL